MSNITDPIILVFVGLVLILGYGALRSRLRSEVWLVLMIVFLYALPRAGLTLPSPINLPLPLAHVLAALFILDWLLLRRSELGENRYFGRFFLLYGVVSGFGLIVGLYTGAKYMVVFLELCFYLLVMGIFFYAGEAFRKREHFLLFIRGILMVSVVVSLYGIAQNYLGGGILIPHLTYATGGEALSRVYLEGGGGLARRVLSSYGDPNVLASQLVVFGGIALALLVGKNINRKTRLYCIVVLTVNVICVTFTGSRAGLICLFLVG